MTGPSSEPPPPPSSEPPVSPVAPGALTAPSATNVVVHLDRRNAWRTGWVLAAVVALAALGNFVIDDGGSVIFTLVMSMLAAIAMEPAVARLSHRMRRGVATMLVMLGVLVFIIIFLLAFGRLLGQQIATFVQSVPALVESAVTWANETFGTSMSAESLLEQ